MDFYPGPIGNKTEMATRVFVQKGQWCGDSWAVVDGTMESNCIFFYPCKNEPLMWKNSNCELVKMKICNRDISLDTGVQTLLNLLFGLLCIFSVISTLPNCDVPFM